MPGGPRPPGGPGQEEKRHQNAIPQNPRLGGDMKSRFLNFLKETLVRTCDAPDPADLVHQMYCKSCRVIACGYKV